MSDLIDRDELIQSLKEYKLTSVPFPYDAYEAKGFNDGIDLAITVIAMTPSVKETAKVNNVHIDYQNYSIEKICYESYGECDNCGENVRLGDKFCSQCGHKLDWGKE